MNMPNIKRKLMSLGVLLPLLNALGFRQALAMGQTPPRPTLTPAQQRLQNMGLVLVVDVTPPNQWRSGHFAQLLTKAGG